MTKTSDQIKSNRINKLWQKVKPILAVLLLAGFPLICVDFALRYVLKSADDRRLQSEFKRLEEKLIRVQPWADPERYFKSLFRKELELAARREDMLPYLKKFLAHLHQAHSRLFSIILFDEQGKVCWVSPDFQPSKRIAELLLQALRKGQYLDWSLLDEHWGLFAPFLGTQLPHGRALLESSHCVKTSNLSQKSWFLYSLHKRFSLFVHIHKIAYRPFQGLRRLVNLEPTDGIPLALISLEDREVVGCGTKAFLPAVWSTVAEYEKQPRSFLRAEGRLWSFLVINASYRLAASVPDTIGSSSRTWLRWYRLGCISFLALLCFITSLFASRERLPYLSLRWKLTGFFLLSAGVPLTILGLLGKIYLNEQRYALTQQVWDEMLSAVRDIDLNPRVYHQKIQQELKDALEGFESADPTTQNLKTLEQKLKILGSRFFVQDYRVIDPVGQAVIQSWEAGKANSRDVILLALMVDVMAYLNREFSEVSPVQLLKAETVFGAVTGKGLKELVDSLVGTLGQITRMEVAAFNSIFYSQVMRRPDRRVTHAFFATWRAEELEKAILNLFVVNRARDKTGKRFFGIKQGPRWLPFPATLNGARSVPQQYRKTYFAIGALPEGKHFERFWKALVRTQRPMFARLDDLPEPLLIAGLPGVHLKGYFLMCVQPAREVDRKIGVLRLQLIGFGCLSGMFTMVIAMLLANKVLAPIRELGTGIEAIRQKRFRVRIPEQDPDELGDLVTMFNSMMGSLAEMAFGRQVQEQLFPKTPLIINGIGVYGISRSATDLGGDYLDYLRVPPHHALVLVGDVTGHGVPAALIMAMSKAVVNTLLPIDPRPETILEHLNRIILDNANKRLFMSLCLLWIDTKTREIVIYCAGHPYPLLQRPDGRIDHVTAKGIVLGFRQKPSFSPVAITLQPGERLLLYTDGLFESLSLRGEDGLDKLVDYLQSRPRLALEATPQDVLDHHPEVISTKSQADDHTFLAVEAIPNQENS